jgi:pimeloyl-ACP methyl ester carboxylesterase
MSLALVACETATTFELEVPGYRTEVGEHKAEGTPRNVIVISLHGKEKGRTHDGNIEFAEQLASAGFTSYTPQMPWYDYSAPVSTAYKLLDVLVKKVAKNEQKVVVAGHSQGAPYALFYTTDHEPPSNVVASILLAPGHLIHRSYKIQKVTADSVSRAKQLIAQGKGGESHRFADFNKGGGIGDKTIFTTPEIYLTYFGLDTSPNFLELISQARKPIFWIDGEEDKLAQRLGYAGIYGTARNHPQNKYATVPGGHVSMWGNAAGPVIEWLGQFE